MRSDDDVLVIDLGDERWSADDLPRPTRRRRYRHAHRIVLLAVLAALVPFTGSARPVPLMTAPLWASEEAGAVLGDRVYTFSSTGLVTARSLHTGAIAWQLDGETPDVWMAQLNGGLLGYVTYPGRQLVDSTGYPRALTRVVDPEDGRRLATVPGEVLGRAPDDSVTVFGNLIADLDQGRCAEGARCLDLSGVDARTGTVAWRLPYQPDRELVWSSNESVIDTLGLVDGRGHFVAYDPATGRPGRDIPIPFWPDMAADAATPAQAVQNARLWSQDAALFGLRSVTPSGVALSRLDLGTGRSWSTTLDAADPTMLHPTGCGRWLCVFDGLRTTVVNRDSGVPIATVDGIATDLGDRDLLGVWALGVWAIGADQALDEARLFDPVAGVDRDVIAGAAQSVGYRPDLLVVRGEATPADAGALTKPSQRGSDIYAIDDRGEAHMVMTIESVQYCQVALREFLVCHRPGGPWENRAGPRLWVWRLPAGVVA